jgi:hypothetical protein
MCFDNDLQLRLKPAPINPFEGLHTTANEGDQMLFLCIASLIEICCATASGKIVELVALKLTIGLIRVLYAFN